MIEWGFLAGAIVTEVVATLSLRVASAGRRFFYVPVAMGYPVAFFLLSLALREGMSLGLAYGIWAAAGVAITSVASRVIFGEELTPVMGAGITLIVGGVLLLELGAH